MGEDPTSRPVLSDSVPSDPTPDYVERNRRFWNEESVRYGPSDREQWVRDLPSWGIFGIPDSEVGILPEVEERDVVELGCGGAYVSAWLARRGGRVVGIDNSPGQLSNARRFQSEFDLRFPLVHGIAERLPFRDESFDVAISEYGAAIWSDPYLWIPEAARVLRPGGRLIFLGNGTILMMCVFDDETIPAEARLQRPYFGMHRFEWPDDDGVEFHLGYGDMIRLLSSTGFEVEDLVELQPKAGSETGYPFVTVQWARQWPAEEVWIARKR